MPYLRHLSGSADLITAPEEIRAGFVALALERNRQATSQLIGSLVCRFGISFRFFFTVRCFLFQLREAEF